MAKTNIEWASHSWNRYTWDCTKVSEGCKNCYMMALAERRGKPIIGRPQLRASALPELKTFPSGAVIFVNSMSDTYHEAVPLEWIQEIHNTAAAHPDKTFLLLTKRPRRALELSPRLVYPPNLWVGTSIEKNKYLFRLDDLLQIPAAGHFLSAEPLLEPLLNLAPYLDQLVPDYLRIRGVRHPLRWVIVGGESGKGRRTFNKSWARQIRDMCDEAGVPFMFKQGSSHQPGQDRLLDGQTWDQTPIFIKTDHQPDRIASVPRQLTLL